jgi:hypothetical protein
MDGDDLTLGTDTMREDGEQEGEGIPCTQKIAKVLLKKRINNI